MAHLVGHRDASLLELRDDERVVDERPEGVDGTLRLARRVSGKPQSALHAIAHARMLGDLDLNSHG